MRTDDLIKYPRTQHIQGSRLQPGDEDLEAVPFELLMGRPLVVEEKMDGANAGVSFTPRGELRLQSRGHFLTGGPRERHFDLFKQWAAVHQEALRHSIGDRYVMFGEWMYAKHTLFYDLLPHYFLEFDLLDRHAGSFLGTPERREVLASAPVVSVLVLVSERFDTLDSLRTLIGPSRFKSPAWKDRLRTDALARGIDWPRTQAQTDLSDQMEGLYVKHEEGGHVVGRYKYVRTEFLQRLSDSDSHWLDRPIIPNLLADSAGIFHR